MKRAITGIGMMVFLIGAGATAGAIEFGESMVKPMILIAIGILTVLINEGGESEEKSISYRSHDASYPSMLDRIR